MTRLTKREAAGLVSFSTTRMNDAALPIAVAAKECGSSQPPSALYSNLANATARAVWPWMKRSDAEVIAKQPAHEQAMLNLLRNGLAERLPVWFAEAVGAGEPKPYKVPYRRAKEWIKTETTLLRALSVEVLIREARGYA